MGLAAFNRMRRDTNMRAENIRKQKEAEEEKLKKVEKLNNIKVTETQEDIKEERPRRKRSFED